MAKQKQQNTSNTSTIMLGISAALFVAGGVMLGTSLVNSSKNASNNGGTSGGNGGTTSSEQQASGGEVGTTTDIASAASMIDNYDCATAAINIDNFGYSMVNYDTYINTKQCDADRTVFSIEGAQLKQMMPAGYQYSYLKTVGNLEYYVAPTMHVQFSTGVRQVYAGGRGHQVGTDDGYFAFFVLDDGSVYYISLKDILDGNKDGLKQVSLADLKIASVTSANVVSGPTGFSDVVAVTEDGEMIALYQYMNL